VFAVGAGETSGTTLVMSTYVSGKVCFTGEGVGA